MIVDVHNLSTFEENFLAEIGNQKCSAIKLHISSFVLCGFVVVYFDQSLDAAHSKYAFEKLTMCRIKPLCIVSQLFACKNVFLAMKRFFLGIKH